MRLKHYIFTFCVFVVTVLLAGAVVLFIKLNFTAKTNGVLDLSEKNNRHISILTGDNRVSVKGAETDKELALWTPSRSKECSVSIDGVRNISGNDDGADGASVLRYSEIYVFYPSYESFEITVQTPDSGISGKNNTVCYIGTAEQIEKLKSLSSAYNFFVIAFIFIVICYNIFYFILRKDIFFLVFILMCMLLAARTLINGDFWPGRSFGAANLMSAPRIDSIIIIFLPAVWIAVTYYSKAVIMPKAGIVISLSYAVLAGILTLIIPASAAERFRLPVELVWLLSGIYILYKSIVSEKSKKKSGAAYLLPLWGVIIMIFCSAVNLLRDIIIGRGALDFLPAGVILYTLLWDYFYTCQYDFFLKDRLRILEELNASGEKERTLELKFLRSQIRPHFINNALNTVIAVSLTNIEQARSLLCHFSTYLQSCYDFKELGDTISIEHELSVVTSYIIIEKARYTNMLNVEYEIDDVSIDIPPLTLQPLVENAIKHNVISKTNPLSVFIYVIDGDESVKIGVRDNGQGFNLNTVPSLLSGSLSGQGVGIYNVNKRLQEIYGISLGIENNEGGGGNVYMVIPKKEKTDKKSATLTNVRAHDNRTRYT